MSMVLGISSEEGHPFTKISVQVYRAFYGSGCHSHELQMVAKQVEAEIRVLKPRFLRWEEEAPLPRKDPKHLQCHFP